MIAKIALMWRPSWITLILKGQLNYLLLKPMHSGMWDILPTLQINGRAQAQEKTWLAKHRKKTSERSRLAWKFLQILVKIKSCNAIKWLCCSSYLFARVLCRFPLRVRQRRAASPFRPAQQGGCNLTDNWIIQIAEYLMELNYTVKKINLYFFIYFL